MRQLSLMEEAFVKILSLQGLLANSTKSSPNNDSSSSAFQFQSVMEGLAYDGTNQAIGHIPLLELSLSKIQKSPVSKIRIRPLEQVIFSYR